MLAKTRLELSACGTSMLRPEAAAHKVHNASRKPKDVVIEELWQHYLRCHRKDLTLTGNEIAAAAAASGGSWVGAIVDEDEK